MNQQLPSDDKSPLEFWAAYIPGEGTKRHYLSNGKQGKAKGLRLWRSQQKAWEWLGAQLEAGKLTHEVFITIKVDRIEGKLALPPEADLPPRLVQEPKPLRFSAPDHLIPITTLHPPSVPTAVDLLLDHERRKARRRPRKR